MKILNVERDGFRMDNTKGYTQEQLDVLNNKLEKCLQMQATDCYSHDVVMDDPEYYELIQQFKDEIARK